MNLLDNRTNPSTKIFTLLLTFLLTLTLLVGSSASAYAVTKKKIVKPNPRAAVKIAPITAATKTVATQNLMIAAKAKNSFNAQQALKSGANVNVRDADQKTPLIWAVINRDVPTIKILLAYKADVNVKDKSTWTPLMYAAKRGYTDVISLLIAAKANVNLTDSRNMTAALFAAEAGNYVTLQALLPANPDLKISNSDGNNTLMLACSKPDAAGADEIVKLMISKGLDVNAKNKKGDTALVLAVVNKRVEAVKALVAAKADVNAQINGQSLIYYASMTNITEIYNILKDAGAHF
ncbi:MAG: ankyrin repeat domain-containing protein [Acidobacteriota bacterium]